MVNCGDYTVGDAKKICIIVIYAATNKGAD